MAVGVAAMQIIVSGMGPLLVEGQDVSLAELAACFMSVAQVWTAT